VTNQNPTQPSENQEAVRRGELVAPETEAEEQVTEPAKVMRIGSMIRQLLEEVRSTAMDDAARERLAEIYERSIVEISEAISPDLQEELHMLTLPFKDGEIPSDAELRIAKAQLVGWLEGLFHGIQATLFAQQIAAQQQLQQMRQIPPGMGGGDPRMGDFSERPGTYI
jgi:Protein of unknown function (DUF2587)